MKGNEKIWELLNQLLASELTAISQYMVHSEMDANWGYDKLHEMVEKRAITEMKHAEKLIGRILFLEGMPIVSNLNEMHIGSDVEKQLRSDRAFEFDAIKDYNAGTKLAAELGDYGTHQILNSILQDEEAHIDEIEEQLDLISQMGLQNYLTQQLG
jgi:bacterioferritin